MGLAGWRDDWEYPASRPRAAKGGIRARSQRGAFGENWWARRWLEVLEGFRIGARLQRGRTYARKGQVLSIEIGKGIVHAKVQGSRATPYQVSIRVRALSPADWQKVAEAISVQVRFAARLLAGRMPPDIETVFTGAGLSLFPERLRDLETQCSCPDWSNPCKHIAAVYYLIGEEFDRDPFLLLRLRGMEREELLALLYPRSADEPVLEETEDHPEPIPADPTLFWRGLPLPDESPPSRTPALPAALPRRLGGFPFWQGERPFLESMEQVYARVSRGMQEPAGEPPAPEVSPVPVPDPGRSSRTRPPSKSRDRAALERDLHSGMSLEGLRQRYDGRVLRPFLDRFPDGDSCKNPGREA